MKRERDLRRNKKRGRGKIWSFVCLRIVLGVLLFEEVRWRKSMVLAIV